MQSFIVVFTNSHSHLFCNFKLTIRIATPSLFLYLTTLFTTCFGFSGRLSTILCFLVIIARFVNVYEYLIYPLNTKSKLRYIYNIPVRTAQ